MRGAQHTKRANIHTVALSKLLYVLAELEECAVNLLAHLLLSLLLCNTSTVSARENTDNRLRCRLTFNLISIAIVAAARVQARTGFHGLLHKLHIDRLALAHLPKHLRQRQQKNYNVLASRTTIGKRRLKCKMTSASCSAG